MDISQKIEEDDIDSFFSNNGIQPTIQDRLVETHVRFLGDATTISQVIQLLAYIRNSIKNNRQQKIIVNLCKNVVNTPFAFDVNNQEIKDYVAQDEININ